MKIQIWNLKKLDLGLKAYEFEEAISATITFAGSWGGSRIFMFGNPD